MKKLLVLGVVVALGLIPAGAAAKPTKTDRTNAAKECRFERGTTAATREAFRVKYGTGKRGRNAFGKCVSRHARSEERQRGAAATNAAKECKAERDANPLAFAIKYGTNVKYPNPRNNNAFGKCVSSKAKAKKQAADVADVRRALARRNAARDCAAERKEIGRAAFGERYGTVRSNRRNAFGKCVSAKAKSRS